VVRLARLIPVLLVGQVLAQDYSFSMPEFTCNTSLEADGTLLIYYEIEFLCEPGAHEIDIVDIGFPDDSYEPGSVAATLGGEPVEDIRESSVLPAGVELHLGERSIHPGGTGLFLLSARNPMLVHCNSSDAERASLQFTPTWFGSQYITGESHFILRFQFPPGADSASVRYFGRPFARAYEADGRMVYEWEETRRITSEYTIGVSFPSDLVACEILERPGPDPVARSSSTEYSYHPGPACLLLPGILLSVFVAGVYFSNRRREKYMPPSIGVEGVGIRRGLTAPQAAMLLGQPLDRVLRLVLFGLFLKDVLRSEDSSGKPVFREGAGDRSSLWEYEKAFLAALRIGVPGREAIDRQPLEAMFVAMVKDLETRMKGFSVGETREYYRTIVSEAWSQVRKSGSSSEIEAVLAEKLEWLFLDPRFEQRAEALPQLFPVFPGRMGAAFASMPSSGNGLTLTQFCSGVAGFLESLAGGIAGEMDGITSSVTDVTNPIVTISESAGGYSGPSAGGGCACACACAGCACACAGGGR
jgi:hypothetical protein